MLVCHRSMSWVYLHHLTFWLRSMEESSPTPWTWLPALVSTGLSDWVPLRGMIVDLGGCLVGCWIGCFDVKGCDS
jgi:hypothetical protein